MLVRRYRLVIGFVLPQLDAQLQDILNHGLFHGRRFFVDCRSASLSQSSFSEVAQGSTSTLIGQDGQGLGTFQRKGRLPRASPQVAQTAADTGIDLPLRGGTSELLRSQAESPGGCSNVGSLVEAVVIV